MLIYLREHVEVFQIKQLVLLNVLIEYFAQLIVGAHAQLGRRQNRVRTLELRFPVATGGLAERLGDIMGLCRRVNRIVLVAVGRF